MGSAIKNGPDRKNNPSSSPPTSLVTTGVPVGTIISWMGTDSSLAAAVASGWLICDGSWAVQGSDGYALYSVISGMFGAYESNKLGAMFRLPDLRGMFMRGFATDTTQDPDIGTRQGLAFEGPVGYPGNQTGQLPSGGEMGTYEFDAVGSHNHTELIKFDKMIRSLLVTTHRTPLLHFRRMRTTGASHTARSSLTSVQTPAQRMSTCITLFMPEMPCKPIPRGRRLDLGAGQIM
jgi:tail collar domain